MTRLSSRRSGFQNFAGYVLGIVVTPWFLNLIVAESPGIGQSALPTNALRLRFPAGDVDFGLSELKGFGRLASCSLFSPMSEFLDQQAARAAATAALGALFDPHLHDAPAKPRATGRKAGPARAAHRAARPAARRRGGAMNAASDFGALGPGALSIVAEIADDRVCSVRVVSSRPTHLTRLFIGRPAEEIPVLAERIYSLCGLSHAIVATRAIGAARGAASRAQSNQAQSIALLSERISELLRSSVTLALHENDAMRLDAGAMRPLAEVFSLTRDLLALAKSSRLTTASDRDAVRSIVEKIGARARILGLPGDPDMLGARPAAGSWFGQLWIGDRS